MTLKIKKRGFKIENTHLQITEDDVRSCTDMKKLRNWDEEISKQIVVMDGKIRAAETEELQTREDKENINKTIHARDLQNVLRSIVRNKMDELKAEASVVMEALFYTYAEQDLEPDMFDSLMKKVKRAMKEAV